MDIFTFIVAIILVITPFVDWTATYILYKAYRASPKKSIAIKERMAMAGFLSIASSLIAPLALARLVELNPGPSAVIILSISLILTSIPSTYWLWLYYNNRLK